MLRHFGDPEVRDWLIEDLEHRYLELHRERGRWSAGLWFWRQVVYGCVGGGDALRVIDSSTRPHRRNVGSRNTRFPPDPH